MQRKIDLALRSNYGNKRNTSTIKYIVIHYTANDGDTDEANGDYFDDTYRGASAHYFVDDDSITQSVPDDYVAYSVGGSKYNNAGGRLYRVATNANTLNIEMCDTVKDGSYNVSEATLTNTITLVKEKQQQYSIPNENVIRHYDVNGKPCPAYYVNESAWAAFKSRLSGSWIQDNTGWWYKNADGSYPASKWLQLDAWYYFDVRGYAIQNTWKQIDSKWYYFDNNCKMCTGWLNLGNKWYYLGTDGVMQTDWIEVKGKWYYLNSDGEMQTGWLELDGTWYYLDTNGVMQTGWLNLNGTWYYLNENGATVTGLHVIDGATYYFATDGHMCRTNDGGALI